MKKQYKKRDLINIGFFIFLGVVLSILVNIPEMYHTHLPEHSIFLRKIRNKQLFYFHDIESNYLFSKLFYNAFPFNYQRTNAKEFKKQEKLKVKGSYRALVQKKKENLGILSIRMGKQTVKNIYFNININMGIV